MTVLSIAERPKVADTDRDRLVAFLEQFLEDARAGLVDCAFVLIKSPDGHWKWDWAGGEFISDMVGRIEVVKTEIIVKSLKRDGTIE